MTFWKNYYHIVWGTKNRDELIMPAFEQKLFRYIVNKAGELGMYIHAVNGMSDHIHVIAAVPPKLAVAKAAQKLKGASAHHVNHAGYGLSDPFVWQRGYGVMTLGETQLARAIAYVERQKEHHAQETTNSWLERIDQPDVEPENAMNSVPIPKYKTIHESKNIYEPHTDPFPF
jgi:REP element-mobilizing transposase RayT